MKRNETGNARSLASSCNCSYLFSPIDFSLCIGIAGVVITTILRVVSFHAQVFNDAAYARAILRTYMVVWQIRSTASVGSIGGPAGELDTTEGAGSRELTITYGPCMCCILQPSRYAFNKLFCCVRQSRYLNHFYCSLSAQPQPSRWLQRGG